MQSRQRSQPETEFGRGAGSRRPGSSGLGIAEADALLDRLAQLSEEGETVLQHGAWLFTDGP